MPKRSQNTAVSKRCAICRRLFIPKRSDCTTCSDECKAESRRISRLKYERRNRVERTRKMREQRQAEMKPVYESGRKTCRYCGRKLNKKKPNKEYCNGLCRQRMYRALANGEKIPAGMSEAERRKMLKNLELERLSRHYISQQNRKIKKPVIRKKPPEKVVQTEKPVCEDREEWKVEVERVMNLPYGERWRFSSKWNQAERNYAKSIELKRIGYGFSEWN